MGPPACPTGGGLAALTHEVCTQAAETQVALLDHPSAFLYTLRFKFRARGETMSPLPAEGAHFRLEGIVFLSPPTGLNRLGPASTSG